MYEKKKNMWLNMKSLIFILICIVQLSKLIFVAMTAITSDIDVLCDCIVKYSVIFYSVT